MRVMQRCDDDDDAQLVSGKWARARSEKRCFDEEQRLTDDEEEESGC